MIEDTMIEEKVIIKTDIPESFISELPLNQEDFEKVLYQGFRRLAKKLGKNDIVCNQYDLPDVDPNKMYLFIGSASHAWDECGEVISEYVFKKFNINASSKMIHDYYILMGKYFLDYYEYELNNIYTGMKLAKQVVWDGKEISITEFAKRFVAMPLAIYSMRNQIMATIDDDKKDK